MNTNSNKNTSLVAIATVYITTLFLSNDAYLPALPRMALGYKTPQQFAQDTLFNVA